MSSIMTAAIPLARFAVRYCPSCRPALWPFIAKHLAWRPHPYRVRTASGNVFEGNTSDIIERFLYYFGCWEPQVEAAMGHFLKPGDTFIDVGANIGYFSLLAARLLGPSGSVVAIEASAHTHRQLLQNVQRNGVGSAVRCVNQAASDHIGHVTLYSGDAGNNGSASVLRTKGTAETTQCAPLTKILTASEMRAAKVIKIDVEGAELAVLKGIDSAALREDVAILVEINPESYAALPQILPGWSAFEIIPRGGAGRYLKKESYTAVPLLEVHEQTDAILVRSSLMAATQAHKLQSSTR